MTIEEKRDLIRRALHTAWGQAKESPEYEKCWWRVIAAVLEQITWSHESAVLDVLRDLRIPNDPERPPPRSSEESS